MKALHERWAARAPGERAILMLLGVLAILFAYIALTLTLERARERAGARVSALRSDVTRIERQAAEIASLRGKPASAAFKGDVTTFAREQAAASTIARAIVRSEAAGPDRMTIVFGPVPFNEWLAWAASLQSQGVRIETSRIEAQAPGIVSVTATFVRSPS